MEKEGLELLNKNDMAKIREKVEAAKKKSSENWRRDIFLESGWNAEVVYKLKL